MTFKPNGHLLGAADGDTVEVFTGPVSGLNVLGLAYSCALCGQHPGFKASGDTVTVRTPCPYPNGLTSRVTLAVPSGKVIVTDSLRPVYDWDDNEIADYNSVLGQHQAIAVMATQGCAFGPVSNSCPGLYRTGEGSYVIANLAYDEENDAEILPGGWEFRAGIITDLWAYSVADYADWQEKGGDPAGLGWGQTVVSVTPGTYEFTHHSGERGFNDDFGSLVVYADIRFLGEA